MLKMLITTVIGCVLITSCSAPLKLNNAHQPVKPGNDPLNSQVAASSYGLKSSTRPQRVQKVIKESKKIDIATTDASVALQNFVPTEIQIKYATMLDIMPDLLTDVKLLETIDGWYGTRYRYGGTTKSGVDCSAFVRAVYKDVFEIDLPRTAREQYRRLSRVTDSELKQGDLLFFNTTGGVSHVGMYLANNKFVHASSSSGVVVSDLEDAYYSARYLGAGRMESGYYANN